MEYGNNPNMDDQDLKSLELAPDEIVKGLYPTLKAVRKLQKEIKEVNEKQEIYQDKYPGSTNQYRHRQENPK